MNLVMTDDTEDGENVSWKKLVKSVERGVGNNLKFCRSALKLFLKDER